MFTLNLTTSIMDIAPLSPPNRLAGVVINIDDRSPQLGRTIVVVFFSYKLAFVFVVLLAIIIRW